MGIDMRRPLLAAAHAALEELDSEPRHKRRGGAGRALLLGAGLVTVGRLAVGSRGREMLETLQEHLPADLSSRDGDASEEEDNREFDDAEPEGEADEDFDEEDEEPEGEADEDFDDEDEEPEGEADDDFDEEDEEPEGEADEDFDEEDEEPDDEADDDFDEEDEEPDDEADEDFDDEDEEEDEEPEPPRRRSRSRAPARSRR